jgi:transposase
LKAAGVSGNEIARRVGVASSTVRLTLKRLAVAGLSWPLPAELADTALEAPESAPRSGDFTISLFQRRKTPRYSLFARGHEPRF